MAVNILNTVTCSEAITVGQGRFTVSSTASIAVGDLMVFGQEAMEVVAIPVSGQVDVTRGVAGTIARAVRSGSRAFTGTPDKFTAIREWSSLTGLTGNADTFPQFLLPGQKAIDGYGNQFTMVELTQTVVPGATVVISRDGNFTAAVLTSTDQGLVGITTENGSSDQYTWVQTKGFVSHAKLVGGSSLLTSLGEFQGATSVSTPSVGLLGRSSSQRSSDYGALATIQGMYPQSAASTASTSASSETGLFSTAFLDDPWVMRIVTT